MLSVPICDISGNIFSPTDFTDFHGFGYMLSVFICVISGNILFSHGFHRFSRIWLHVICAHLCHQWEMFFSPTDFTDFHRFGYMLSVPICVISGECSFFPRISQIFTDLVTCYPCPFVSSVGNIFLPRISLICTDLVTCYPYSFDISGNIFSPTDFTDFHRFGYMLSVPICGISGNIFSPTDFTDFHRFGYMLSVFICGISGNIFSPTDFHRFARIWLHVIRVHLCYQWGMFFSPTDFTDLHGFVFLVAANALGIGAASFWSVSGKRYSGKPDGDSRNALLFKV